MNRTEIANLILTNLNENKDALKKQFLSSKDEIGYFYLDNLLPETLALEIYQNFPDTKEAVKKKT